MTVYLLADHLLNLVAPAAIIALLLVLLSRLFPGFFRSKQSLAQVWRAQAAINFVVGVVLLAAGLVLLGRDGKMLTYVIVVLGVAGSQWWQLGGWKR
ncbi:MAG: hypothetical protein ABIQ90_16130 [Polaromonas sp.]